MTDQLHLARNFYLLTVERRSAGGGLSRRSADARTILLLLIPRWIGCRVVGNVVPSGIRTRVGIA